MGAFQMNWKSTVAVSGAGLLATWLGVAPSLQPAVGVDLPPGKRDVRPVETGADIEKQASRLQTRVRTELDYRDPSRNPFRFAARPPAVAPTPSTVSQPSLPLPPPPGADLFAYTLSGMAADKVDGQTRRTAIISTASDVLFVKEGDHVASYTVTAINETGVELTAADGTVRRLTLIP